MKDIKNKSCFVIMPFTATSEKHSERYWNDFYEIIKAVVESLGYICKRSETGPHSIIKQIVENINSSEIAISVLTDLNPNVWYELGIRHSLKNGTVMLIEKNHKIPFDINSYGLIQYDDGISLYNKLSKELKEYLNKLDNSQCCDSPVLDTIKSSTVNRDKIDEMYKLIIKIANEKDDSSTKNIKQEFWEKPKYNRILWVDDYPSNNQAIIDLFEKNNMRFDIALTTAQGINLCKENKYDVIITDMGRGNQADAGLELIKQIRGLPQNNEAPIFVFASGKAISIYGEEAYKLGASIVTNNVSVIISKIANIFDRVG